MENSFDQWIPASNPPKVAGEYLCAVGLRYVMKRAIGFYSGAAWDFGDDVTVCYWMPLPKLPHPFAPKYKKLNDKLSKIIEGMR